MRTASAAPQVGGVSRPKLERRGVAEVVDANAAMPQGEPMRAAHLAPIACLVLAGCHDGAPISRVPAGQEGKVADIPAHTPNTAPPRTGGFLAPQETGRQIRAQAVRPPTPGGNLNPPPPGT